MGFNSFRAMAVQIIWDERAYHNPTLLSKFSRRRFWAYRAVAAGSPFTPTDDLLRLAGDDNWVVVRCVAFNSEAPEVVHQTLLKRLRDGHLAELNSRLPGDVAFGLTGSNSLSAAGLFSVSDFPGSWVGVNDYKRFSIEQLTELLNELGIHVPGGASVDELAGLIEQRQVHQFGQR